MKYVASKENFKKIRISEIVMSVLSFNLSSASRLVFGTSVAGCVGTFVNGEVTSKDIILWFPGIIHSFVTSIKSAESFTVVPVSQSVVLVSNKDI